MPLTSLRREPRICGDRRGLSCWAHSLFVTVCHSRRGAKSNWPGRYADESRGSSSSSCRADPPGPDAGTGVMVMDKDEKLRRNRLALLAEVTALFADIADFTKIVSS